MLGRIVAQKAPARFPLRTSLSTWLSSKNALGFTGEIEIEALKRIQDKLDRIVVGHLSRRTGQRRIDVVTAQLFNAQPVGLE